MWKLSILVCFCCLLAHGGTAFSQSKVAEGEYQMRNLSTPGSPNVNSPNTKTFSRWVLYGKSDGGYHLSSEIQNVPGGMRVVQLEDLDSKLVPATIGFELYPRNETKPAARVSCALIKTSVSCHGDDSSKELLRLPPLMTYKAHSSFGFATLHTLISAGRWVVR
jgi:hypothetical protein